MEQTTRPQENASDTTEQEAERNAPKRYGPYCPQRLGFDPMKDLNLPGSYDEVVMRFKRLQGDRAEEVLN
ncbi:MAG TPA: hypothetical protein PLN54_06910 [Flavobacteriales bacterium]|nr:hypothetical protein [Flavobacteriales bacterium]